jgi:hypothetical protein
LNPGRQAVRDIPTLHTAGCFRGGKTCSRPFTSIKHWGQEECITTSPFHTKSSLIKRKDNLTSSFLKTSHGKTFLPHQRTNCFCASLHLTYVYKNNKVNLYLTRNVSVYRSPCLNILSCQYCDMLCGRPNWNTHCHATDRIVYPRIQLKCSKLFYRQGSSGNQNNGVWLQLSNGL